MIPHDIGDQWPDSFTLKPGTVAAKIHALMKTKAGLVVSAPSFISYENQGLSIAAQPVITELRGPNWEFLGLVLLGLPCMVTSDPQLVSALQQTQGHMMGITARGTLLVPIAEFPKDSVAGESGEFGPSAFVPMVDTIVNIAHKSLGIPAEKFGDPHFTFPEVPVAVLHDFKFKEVQEPVLGVMFELAWPLSMQAFMIETQILFETLRIAKMALDNGKTTSAAVDTAADLINRAKGDELN